MSTSVELSQNVGESKENLHTALDDLEVASVNDFESLILKGNDETVLARADNFLSYTKNDLIAIKDAHLSKIRPAALSDRYCNRDGEWDPEQWYYSNESVKRSASPIDKKKSYIFDGVILSPQGRSFAAGCQVTTGKKDEHYGAPKDTIDARKKTNSRTVRGWEARGRGRSSPKFDGERKVDRNNIRNERKEYKGGRKVDNIESQPEWFTHGPISQLDTIELKGFDDDEKSRKKRKRDKNNVSPAKEEESPPSNFENANEKFDINEFFDMAESALPVTAVYDSQRTGGSRFSQWFANGRSRSNSLKTSSRNNSRRSSLTDELAEIAGLTLHSPSVRSDSPDFMFAPIAPANEAMNKQDDVMTVIQDSDVDVQPLLDSVIPHQTVKGAVTLKDIEGKEDAPIDGADKKVPDLEDQQGSQVFHKLVETMKASGNLPEKPTPTIPDLPPHLLPRPPSSKDKSRSVQKSRTPSPRQLLQEFIRRTQSPTALVNHTQNEENREVSYGRMRAASPLAEMLSPGANALPLSPRDLYGSPSVFSMNGNDDGVLVITGATKDTEKKSKNRNIPSRYGKEVENSSVNLLASTSDNKPSNSAVISQAFVPTSVLRKLHCDKHDLKLSESRITNKPSTDQRNISSDDLSAVEEREGLYNSVNKSAFTSPKTNTDIQPELFTPHRLPLPTSPSVTPLSLPLPQTPLVGRTSETFTKNPSKPFNTPHSLPLPRSPLVSNANTTPPSDFGIRPLLKFPSFEDSVRVRGRSQRKPSDQRQNHNLKRFQHNQLPYGAMNIMPRPGALPAPFNLNAVRAMNVHPTALALALRNQQYQMARAAAVAAANAVVNRPVISPAQAAAALMFNQQRIAGAFRGVMPQLNPRMIHNNVPRRPNLPPALQRQHHVVHHSGDHMKDNSSLSKWFSDAVLSQTPSQAPSRGAKVLSVEELERHS